MKRYHPNLRRQAGGTFLGLILGLIVGLGIAVVVALAITRSPVPLGNKLVRQERSELSPSQTSDPNKPLYGKDVVREAPSAPSAAQDADWNESAPDTEEPDMPPAKADAPQDKPDAVTTDQLARSGSTAADRWIYFLQTGAFRQRADAENARAQLALLGFEAKVSERPSSNGILYRVRIGPVTQSEIVNRIRSKLSEDGINASIVRIPK
ncbi:MAG: SPOR domain-containing protein [Herbaspirillum sp.]